MSYCLIKPLADVFKKALSEGKIDPQKLADMSSAERRSFFTDLLGEENASKVNVLFEQKSLLKDTQAGMIAWAKEVAGITPEVRRSLINRIERLDERILNPATEKAFLEELAAKRLGIEVTMEEAKHITELSKHLTETKANYKEDPLKYGAARRQMENFLNDIKRENDVLTLAEAKANPGVAAGKALSTIAGTAKSLKATLDMSALLRQGGKAAINHPVIWAANVTKTFEDAWKTLKTSTSDEGVMDGLMAEIYARPNAFDGTYEKMGLAIGTGEEAFPSSLPEKVPGLGRAFKASEVAYNGFLTRLRADLADGYLKDAESRGVDIKDPKELKAIGQLVNSLTGRGKTSTSNSGLVNAAFFSPKNFKANLDFFTAHQFEGTLGGDGRPMGKQTSTKYTRFIARKNLLRYLAAAAAVAAVAHALWPDSVETDFTSSDAGRIKIGDTRFDISGGIAPVATFLARLITFTKKSSTTGAKEPLGTGFGQTTVGDLFGSFASNKLSPGAAAIKDLATRTDSSGQPLTVQAFLNDLFTPLPISTGLDLRKSKNRPPAAVIMGLDFFGIPSNTYGDATKVGQRFVEKPEVVDSIHKLENLSGKKIQFEDWTTTKLQDVNAFKATLSPNDWQSALMRYDFQIKERVDEALASEKFKNFSPEDKVSYINQLDTDAKEKVFSQFNYKYAKPKGLPKKKLKL